MTTHFKLSSLTISLTIFLLQNFYGQNNTDTGQYNDNKVFEIVEILPEFPGGDKGLRCFIDKNVDKKLLNSTKIKGLSSASFTVDTTGQVRDIKINRSLTKEVDDELIRIIGLMPKWTPGRQRDKLVDVTFVLPLKVPYDNKLCR